jgi:hypothetical protein
MSAWLQVTDGDHYTIIGDLSFSYGEDINDTGF